MKNNKFVLNFEDSEEEEKSNKILRKKNGGSIKRREERKIPEKKISKKPSEEKERTLSIEDLQNEIEEKMNLLQKRIDQKKKPKKIIEEEVEEDQEEDQEEELEEIEEEEQQPIRKIIPKPLPQQNMTPSFPMENQEFKMFQQFNHQNIPQQIQQIPIQQKKHWWSRKKKIQQQIQIPQNNYKIPLKIEKEFIDVEIKNYEATIPKFCPVCNSKIKKEKVFQQENVLFQGFHCKNKDCNYKKQIIVRI